MLPQARSATRLFSMAALALSWSCTETVVVPVAVMDITVVPARVDALVSDQTPLTTEIRDQDGNVLTGRDVSWASLDPSVAAVDANGIITAVGPGQALITATADGVVGSAQVSVQERPTVRISPGSIELATVQGNGGALQRVANVENGGGGVLESLSVQVEYDGGGRQWLSASLSGSEAPAALNLSARATGLPVGLHRALVVVTSPQGSATLSVTLDVSEPPPSMTVNPGTLGFTVIGGRDEPDAATAQVSNGGGGSLNGLGVQITYGGTGGWLSATLSRDTAPATLTVRPTSTALTPGTHSATIRVTSAAAPSKTVSVSYVVQDPKDFEPPQAPDKLEIEERGSDRIDLDWRDRSDNETRFEIHRRQLGVPWALVATLGEGAESYRDEPLQAVTWYQYRVRACNAGGCSDFSNWRSTWTSN